MQNLATLPAYQEQKESLKKQLQDELTAQRDPRVFGNGLVFEKYQYSDPRMRGFYERYMQGEKVKAGWVNETDFESGPLD